MWRRFVISGVCVVAAACSVPVAANLDEADANQAILLLERGGVGADKEHDPDHENRFRVSVSRPDGSSAISLLAQENLPPKPSPGVLEALGSGSMVPSRLSEQARWTTGTSGDLERSLRTLDGVLSARVHLALPAHDPLSIDAAPERPSASVLVRHRGATPPLATLEVQRLVAGAVPGLAAEQVHVVQTSTVVPRPSERELSRFGPITVTRGSVSWLRLGAVAAVAFNLLLVGALGWLWSRLRRTELQLIEARAPEGDASRTRK